MKLEYNILWIDDDDGIFENGLSDDIEEYLQSLGFKPVIKKLSNGTDIDAYLVNSNKYDLIVSDFNLGNNDTGEKIIRKIRENRIFTEVLLYSSSTQQINRIIQNGRIIERISFSSLKLLDVNIIKLINLTLHKVQDVNAMRGLVMAETISLENIMRDINCYYLQNCLNDSKNRIIHKIRNRKLDKLEQDINKLKNTDISTIFGCKQEINLLSFYDVYNLTIKILKEENNNLPDRKLLKDFQEEIIKVRNKLAHVQERHDENGNRYLINKYDSSDKYIINEDTFINIRKNIIKYDILLNEIHNKINLLFENNYNRKQVATTK